MKTANAKQNLVKRAAKQTLWSRRSRFQTVELIRDAQGLLFKLNGWPQVHSHEEELYHEGVATLPMMLARNVKRCAVLGGGDGLAARNMLRFDGVEKVTLAELDPAVIEMCSTQPDFAAMNEGVFDEPRLDLVIGDAIEWFLRAEGFFDVIINDIETVFTRQPKAMTLQRHFGLFQAMREKLSDGGVAVVTVPDDFDPRVLEGFYESFGASMPAAARRKFEASKDVFVRARLLLGTLFPHVLQWTIDFPILGSHANYYLSNRPMKRFRRFPWPSAAHIREDFLSTTLR